MLAILLLSRADGYYTNIRYCLLVCLTRKNIKLTFPLVAICVKIECMWQIGSECLKKLYMTAACCWCNPSHMNNIQPVEREALQHPSTVGKHATTAFTDEKVTTIPL